jgi:hypothetical protein
VITLYGFGQGFGLPEKSPFVTKTEVQLKMAGLSYRKEKAVPPASPKGQLPYIVDEAESIADSTFIRAHIEAKYGFDFDAPLSLQARAQAWAFERMIEHHVYWAIVGARWVDPENFAKGPAHFFDAAPEHLRDKLREDAQFRVAENYLLSDLARRSREIPQSHCVCRPDDAAILSGLCLDFAARSRVITRALSGSLESFTVSFGGSWFETREAALLTMRVRDLILGRRVSAVSKDGCSS